MAQQSAEAPKSLNDSLHNNTEHPIHIQDPELQHLNSDKSTQRNINDDVADELKKLNTSTSADQTAALSISTSLTTTVSSTTLLFCGLPFKALTPGSLRASTFNLTASGIGAGMLSLPFVWGQVGFVAGLLLLIGGCALTVVTMNLLLYCGIQTQSSTYSAMCNRIYGGWLAHFMDAVIVTFSTGTLTAYFLIVYQYMQIILKAGGWWDETNAVKQSTRLLCVFIYVIVFPLCSLRRISKLRYASLLSIIAMSTVAFIVMIKFFTSVTMNTVFFTRLLLSIPNPSSLPTCLSIVIFAFAAHVQAIPCTKELTHHNEGRARKVVFYFATTQLFLYTLICVFGFATFGADSHSNILLNYSPTDASALFARILVVLTLILHAPLQTFPALEIIKESVCHRCLRLPANHTMLHILLTFLFISICLSIAVWVPEISVVFSLLGATCSTLIAFIVPGACYLKLSTDTPFNKQKALVCLLIVFAIPFSVFAVYYNVQRIRQGQTTSTGH